MKTSIKFGNDTRNVLFAKDNLPTIGAVLGALSEKPCGLSRFGVLKNAKVAAVLKSRKITKETEQVNEIGKAFAELAGKGVVVVTNGKVPEAKIVSEYNDLSKEVVQVAEKIELPKVEGGKRGRPAGSGKSATGKGNSVQRNPAPVKTKRFSLIGGKVVAWSIGKPSKDQRLNECDEKGNIIADIDAINAVYAAAEEAKAMKVQRNPTAKVGGKRFYLKDGVVTPFGLGKPGFDKLSNECTQAGELIDNSALVATLRQPKAAPAAKSSKINQLEAQLAQMAEMMKVMQQMMMGAAIPQQVQAVTVAPAAAEVAKVEPVAQVTETVVEKPAKAAKSAKSSTSKAKPAKAAKVAKSKDIEDEEDPYGSFANNVSDLGDDEPIAFGSDGFVVTEMYF